MSSMSHLGHSRRFGRVPPTSALPPSTDIVRSARQVRFVPEGDIPCDPAFIPDRQVLVLRCSCELRQFAQIATPRRSAGASDGLVVLPFVNLSVDPEQDYCGRSSGRSSSPEGAGRVWEPLSLPDLAVFHARRAKAFARR